MSGIHVRLIQADDANELERGTIEEIQPMCFNKI